VRTRARCPSLKTERKNFLNYQYNSVMNCPIVLEFGRLRRAGLMMKDENDWRDWRPQVEMQR